MSRVRVVGCVASVFVCVLIAAPAALGAPPNDNFANATPIQRLDDSIFSNRILGDNVNATSEFQEPDHRNASGTPTTGGSSVWYSFTPDHTSTATFIACTNNSAPGWVSFDPLIGVYTGSALNTLTSQGTYGSVDCDPSPGSPGTDLQNEFQAVSGNTYYLAVAGVGGGGEQGNLLVAVGQAPVNDDFANATTLTGTLGQRNDDNVSATEESGEPSHLSAGTPAGSIWYQWTAPMAGKATFNTCGSDTDAQFKIYTGGSVNSLTLIKASAPAGCARASASFTAVKNTTYRIGVDSTQPQDAITLNYNEKPFPETTITSGPIGLTKDATPTFAFKSSLTGSTFQCKIDGQAYGACSGPGATHTPASALADGAHTFFVKAIKSGVADPTPAKRSFTVDTHAPQTTITSGPSGVTHDQTPTFKFSSSEAGSTFQCLLRLASGSGSFGSCSGPGASHTPSLPLANGKYVFSVRARDKAGNLDATPASRSFTVSH